MTATLLSSFPKTAQCLWVESPNKHELVKVISQALFSKMIFWVYIWCKVILSQELVKVYLEIPNSLASSRCVLNYVHFLEARCRNATTSEHHVFRNRLVCEWVCIRRSDIIHQRLVSGTASTRLGDNSFRTCETKVLQTLSLRAPYSFSLRPWILGELVASTNLPYNVPMFPFQRRVHTSVSHRIQIGLFIIGLKI